ncbi:hypothetical protein [Phenylobacterium sp.]|uniref:hypothetical protein n=1 Tax=Phenylobacterium sp. TaxID=1871053 RepID=UPI0025DEFD16|nr:hypothetical protein [Phenylobacterium sp.]
MKLRLSLLAGAAASVVLASGHCAEAASPAPRESAAEAERQAAEIETLKAQVQALTERLAAQEQRQQALERQAAEADAAAKVAQAKAAAQIETIPAQVKTAVAEQAPKPDWTSATKVSGRMYFDLSHVDVERDGANVAPSGTGFDIKRFYVGVDHRFDDTFSANVTTDVQYNDAEGLTQVYIKKAYLQAKVADALTVRLGSADLPWVPFAEDVYGYRFVENTVADRDKFGTSADWGVHAFGKLGMVDYAVSAINGAGYKSPTRSKSVDFEGRLSTTVDHFTFGVGGYTGKLGKDKQGVVTYHRAERLDAIAAYRTDRFRVGAEYFAARNWNNVTTVAGDKSDGYSLFGSFNITPQVAAFGRYDRVRTARDTVPGRKDSYFNLGLNYEPAKIVDLALVYKRDKVDNGLISTSNGAIGGVAGGTYDEVGLFGQFRW